MEHRYALNMKKGAVAPDCALFMLVPPVRVERTLLAELDFESSASTNSATGAQRGRC